jgi:HicB_like antitoxin of bacterial toxin-antitoxin system
VITYAIIIERAEDGGYGAWCPDLLGCVALGDTEAETIAEMTEAIKFHIDRPGPTSTAWTGRAASSCADVARRLPSTPRC